MSIPGRGSLKKRGDTPGQRNRIVGEPRQTAVHMDYVQASLSTAGRVSRPLVTRGREPPACYCAEPIQMTAVSPAEKAEVNNCPKPGPKRRSTSPKRAGPVIDGAFIYGSRFESTQKCVNLEKNFPDATDRRSNSLKGTNDEKRWAALRLSGRARSGDP